MAVELVVLVVVVVVVGRVVVVVVDVVVVDEPEARAGVFSFELATAIAMAMPAMIPPNTRVGTPRPAMLACWTPAGRPGLKPKSAAWATLEAPRAITKTIAAMRRIRIPNYLKP